MSDMVNKPSHYISDNGIETIDVIEAFTKDLDPFEAYCTGNIIKYICRWKHKNGMEDLKKARWYINKLLKDKTDTVEVPEFVYNQLKRFYPFGDSEWSEVDNIYNMRTKDDYFFAMLSDDECLGKHIVELPDGSKIKVSIKREK